jgi:Tol biopolymer transport system component/DNA-binding winged helix-turn-helix (wHTH) protein
MDSGSTRPVSRVNTGMYNDTKWNERNMRGDEQREGPRTVRFGIFEVDLAAGELRREGTLVKLQDQPFRLLALLLERPGAVVTREELRAALWPDGSFVDFEYGVNTAVKKVRNALGDSVENPRFVQTIPRKGYRFIAPAAHEAPSPATAAAPSVVASTKRRRTWMIAAALAALTGSGLWLVRQAPAPGPASLPVPLTTYPGSEWSAAFSPDGRQVAFAWNGVREDNYDIYLKTNGSDSPTRLTTDPASDLSPAWSPDGHRIAFLRDLGRGRVAVMMVPAAGGPEVKIAETSAPLFPYYRNLAFSPDGNWLITADLGADAPGREARPAGLFLYSVENGSRRPLTLPPAGYYADTNPALAPDGRSLAFLRGPEFLSEDLYVLPLDRNYSASGEPRRLTSWNRFTLNPAWTADGRGIIVAAGERDNTHLWRVPVSGRGRASIVASAGDGAMLAAFASDGRLAFTRARRHISIWTLDLAASRKTGSWLSRWPASSSGIDANPRFSPDGRRVAFVSNRTGTYQIWIANTDGSGAFQLTSITASLVGCPSWSPDGSTILFDGSKDGHFEGYAISAAGGTPRRLMGSSGQDGVASFSRDGQWIYFTSNRTGEFQIWRMPAQGGEAVQWTRRGGRVARESVDGRHLYFAKPLPDGYSLWRMPAAGGEETQVLKSVLAFSFDVTKSGIYYVDRPGLDGLSPMYFYSFAAGRSTQLAAASLQGANGISVSSDGLTLIRSQTTEAGADLMVMENIR